MARRNRGGQKRPRPAERKQRAIVLYADDYSAVHRILISTAPQEGMGQLRTLNELIDIVESCGQRKQPKNNEDPAVVLFEIEEDDAVELRLSPTQESAFRSHLVAGVKRYPAFLVRSVPAIMDRLDAAPWEGEEEVPADEG
jgi:hypothetical protein